MTVKKRIVKKPNMNKTEAESTQLELFNIKQNIKQLEARETELKNRLGEYMMKSFKPDAKGHFLFSTINSVGEKIHLQRQARKKVELNEERAKKLLAELGKKDLVVKQPQIAVEVTKDQLIDVLLEHAPHLIDEVETVDEKALEQAVLNEEIPMETFEEMCDINVTYAMTFIDDKKLQQE